MRSRAQYNHLDNAGADTATLRLSWQSVVWYNPRCVLRRNRRTLTPENPGEQGYHQLGTYKATLGACLVWSRSREWL